MAFASVAPERLAAELTRRLGGRADVNAGSSVRSLHGEDASPHPRSEPDVVVMPRSTEAVADVLSFALEAHVPVTPWGMGTSLEGSALPLHGGISLDLSGMTKVIALDPESRTVSVEAGVTRLALERITGEHGLLFPVDPGADATLGGMAATNAAGTTTLRHGKMRDNLRALRVVLADGSTIRTGTRAAKSSAGYDLTSVFTGSEGTLGVITELTLRLQPVEEASAAFRVSFASLREAGDGAVALATAGLPLLRLELLDGFQVAGLNAFRGLDLPEGPLLLGDLTGSEGAVADGVGALEELIGEVGGGALLVERGREAQRRLWRARHDLYFAERARFPGRTSYGTDVCVPLSALGRTLEHSRAALDASGLDGGIVAHAGDGNVHVGILVDPADPTQPARVRELVEALVGEALAAGGTCTGEHGVGIGKIVHLAVEHADSLGLMRGIKSLCDPTGIMNPGKLFAERGALPSEQTPGTEAPARG